jgi:hypothetical protein
MNELEVMTGLREANAEGRDLVGARMEKGLKMQRMREVAARVAELEQTRALIQESKRFNMLGASVEGQARYSTPAGPTVPSGMTGNRIAPVQLGERVMKSLFHAAQSRQNLRVDLKDLSSDLESDIPPILGPALGRIIEPTRISSLLPAVGMSGPAIQYPRITGQTGSADVVAPGALKPSVGFTTDLVYAAAVKIAGITTITDELGFDYEAFTRLVSSELATAVILAENSQLLYGDGTAGSIDGLLHSAGLTQTATAGETVLDTVEMALTTVRVGAAYAEPDGVVLHPNDWSRLRRAKDVTGRYLLTEAPSGNVVPTLFGVPVITTTTIDEGTALVGAFAIAAALHVRLGLTVEANNRSDTDWTHNTTTFRAEERIALAIYRPAALCAVTLPTGA